MRLEKLNPSLRNWVEMYVGLKPQSISIADVSFLTKVELPALELPRTQTEISDVDLESGFPAVISPWYFNVIALRIQPVEDNCSGRLRGER